MNSAIYIIHRSAIVRQGLGEILRKHYKGPIGFFGDFSSFQTTLDRSCKKVIVFVEEIVSSELDFNEFLNANAAFQYIEVCNNKNHSIHDCDNMSLCLFDSEEDINNQIKDIIEQIINEKEETEGLSARELDVLKLVAVGLSNKEIAGKLFISTHTVMSHRKNITEKLGIKSISGLTVYAIINNHLDTTNLNISDLI